MTTSQYLNSIKSGAIEGWRTHQVLPSITGAQAALESGWGTSSLAQSPYNNNFGIKASDDWTGRIVTMPTKEWTNSGYITVQADFRAYDSIADSVRDHAAFFTNTPWREQNYKDVIGERDYKKAAWALQNAPAPYATDPGYATKLINIIENNKLDEWDKEALTGQTTSPTTPSLNQPDMQPKPKKTGAELSTAGRSFVQSLKVSVIGDSLGVGTEPYLKQLIPNSNYDVVGSRQITHSIESLDGTRALTKMKSNGTLHDYVVVILGTNRGVTEQEVNNFASIAGNSRKVLFVNTASQVGHANEVSRVYNKLSTSLSNAYFVDWQTYALSMREAWYYSDGSNGEYIHMNAEGYRRHAEFIAQAIYESATADFSEETAVDTLTAYTNIATIELTPDGMISFDAFDMDGNKVHFDRDIGVKGLSSPMGDFHIYNHEANERWNTQDSNEFGANWIEGFYEDSNRKLDIMLIEEAAKYMDQHREPSAQYTVSLFEVPQNLSIGDTGIFIDHEFTPPLYIQARVLSISTSRTNSSLNKVTIGNVVELEPMEKDSTIALQGELSRVRDGIYDQWVKGEPPRLEIIALDSTTLTDENTEVLLICKVFQGNIEVTEQFSNFRWSRVSEDTVSDSYFNDVIYDAETSSVINVKARDLEGIASTFLCRVYDDANRLIGTISTTVSKTVRGKSAYELAIESGFEGTEEEWLESLKGETSVGQPGPPGENNFIHTAWADDDKGTGFTTAHEEGKTWLGTTVTESRADPEDWRAYDWQKVQGPKGNEGEKGEDGESASGINLLLNGDNSFSTTSYQVAQYTTTEDIKAGEEYTFTLRGTKKSTQNFGLWQNGGSNGLGSLTSLGDNLYQLTFTAVAPTADYRRIFRIYQPDSSTAGQATIEWATLVKGAVGLEKFIKSPEQLQGEIDNKASNSALTGVSNEVGALSKSQRQMQENMEAYLKQQEEYNQWLQDVEGDAKKANDLAEKVDSAQVDIQTELNDQAQKWVTQEGYIQFDGETNTISIASESKNTQMIIDDEALGFYSGGTRVAAITNQYLQIDRGIFTKSAQMGNHKFEPLASNPDHFILSYVKGG
ncbi:glucosaminidase domain-containing protein [Ruoffia tabacinasalis]|uniref:Glucosaminidase domain-containing protein n=1 Tax=Ruoffia tabacinasalis TaxID=87458 RepID=A0ABS0LGN0_9LACT|nr:glucosaminidase domain-containing protein [Ruoffia tabacinasalis]MBG9977224.1 glucosaminidase domain-containing protein [Ruoffia tabacinasalis]